MRNLVKPAVVLFVIAAIAAALLGYVNAITAEPIAQAEADAKSTNMAAVLECDEWNDSVEVEDSIITDYSEGIKDGKTVGYAFSVTTKGYGSGLKLMVGVDTEGTITGLSIVDCSNETPGLGAESAKPKFYSQFAGKKGELTVVKGGGNAGDSEIDAITGATITSKAVTNAVNTVTEYFEENLKGGVN
jgi:electron transport complex protein RnfG